MCRVSSSVSAFVLRMGLHFVRPLLLASSCVGCDHVLNWLEQAALISANSEYEFFEDAKTFVQLMEAIKRFAAPQVVPLVVIAVIVVGENHICYEALNAH